MYVKLIIKIYRNKSKKFEKIFFSTLSNVQF